MNTISLNIIQGKFTPNTYQDFLTGSNSVTKKGINYRVLLR